MSKDSKYVAFEEIDTNTGSGSVYVLKANASNTAWETVLGPITSTGIYHVQFSHNGMFLAVQAYSLVQVWQRDAVTNVWTQRGNSLNQGYTCSAISEDGNTLLVGIQSGIQPYSYCTGSGSTDCGGAYVYKFVGGSWTQVDLLVYAVHASTIGYSCAMSTDVQSGSTFKFVLGSDQSPPRVVTYVAPAPCSSGTYSATGMQPCTDCPAGKYGNSTGLTACTNCPAGTYGSVTRGTSSTACANCAAGTYSSANASSACTQCGVGTYSALSGQSACTPCIGRTYADAGSTGPCLPATPSTKVYTVLSDTMTGGMAVSMLNGDIYYAQDSKYIMRRANATGMVSVYAGSHMH